MGPLLLTLAPSSDSRSHLRLFGLDRPQSHPMMYGMVGKTGKLNTQTEQETSGHQDIEDFIAPASRGKS